MRKYKKRSKQMKNKITEMKNTLEGINSRSEDRRNGPVSGKAE